MLTIMADDPRGFGRVVRAADGKVEAIVEEYVATPGQLQIHELNVGAYCFEAAWLWDALKRIQKNPKKGEYYLTKSSRSPGGKKTAQAVVHDDQVETIGINNRVHLAEAEAALRRRINRAHMLDGVSIPDPDSTYIDVEVVIGEDTIVQPNTHILGRTTIGKGNVIGPNTIIRDSTIGDRCSVLASVMDEAVLEDEVEIGPFARLRHGAHLARHVHMGNFGEVKDSYLAPGVKVGHFSYIGNATIGENTNIGAGTITCNFDGEKKNPTVIGDDAFLAQTRCSWRR
jgi:bifunctional UDP-N-acetylglucosamine pyrophosphorylase/glucosamine-1-phosphate N-acetyltransferase